MILIIFQNLSVKSEVCKELHGQSKNPRLGIFPSANLFLFSQYFTLSQRNINITIRLLPRRQNKPPVSQCQLLPTGGKNRVLVLNS